ncbi:MAG: glycoside hydrolase family 35 protein [Terriglobales bacterium]
MRRRRFLQAGAAVAALAALPRAWASRRHPFEVGDNGFLLDGRPFLIRSGSMHYPRVPRPYWRDRMRKLRALGLNTLCTYVFWNMHEPRPGQFDFTGQNDLAAYLRTAQEEGLWVILRPGPYVCTEWDFGGFPAWLLHPPGMRVRSADPLFLRAADRYLQQVGAQVAHLEAARGGPILLVQVENEYGSFGSDHNYLAAIAALIRKAGFRAPLYTSNGPGPKMLADGSLPHLTSVINFGDGDDPAQAFRVLEKFRPHGPRMCGEYWVGWFDHWGERHHTTPPRHSARGLDWMLSRGISCNLYMAHGGTSFGFMAGANYGRSYEPDTTSYDYDAPLDEAGRPTAKFHALRAVLARHLPPGEHLQPLPPPLPIISVPRFPLTLRAPLAQLLPAPHRSPRPLPMEALGQAYGLVLYRTRVNFSAKGLLQPLELRDYARVYINGREAGELERSEKRLYLQVSLAAGDQLDILVENMGRINFGPRLQDNLQGIPTPVLMDLVELKDWDIFPLPLNRLGQLRFVPSRISAPAFHCGSFQIEDPGDTFLDLRGWGKGCVWVNRHNLGRFWNRGPQQSLFLPGCWLHRGQNEAIVFDWGQSTAPTLAGLPDPIYSGEAYAR